MRVQTPLEEKLNAFTHAIAVGFGCVAFFFLIEKKQDINTWSLFSVIVYGCAFIGLFLASTLYHAIANPKLKHYFRILDHVGIYILIAGTYTPVVLILLQDSLGWELFYTVWSIALLGTLLKLFFTGKFNTISTLLYVIMGWLIIFDYEALSKKIAYEGLYLLFAGGLAYTGGIVFYALEKLYFNHVIWHILVVIGALCHFFMIYYYVK